MVSVRTWFRRFYAASSFADAAQPRASLTVDTTKGLFLHRIHDPLEVDMLSLNSQLKDLVNRGHLHGARKMFDTLPYRDTVSWMNVISGYIKAYDASEALYLFSRMWVEADINVDPFTVSLALKASGAIVNGTYGESLHGYSMKTGLVNSIFVGSALVDMYFKVGKVLEGCRVFDEMPLRNVVSCTAMITGLVRAGYNKSGLIVFKEMQQEVPYDPYSFAIALKACAEMQELHHGIEIHAYAIKKGFDASSYVANSLATMYTKCHKLNYALRLFEKMDTVDVVSWTNIIAMYMQMGEDYLAIQLFLRMRESSVAPNGFTFAAAISSCANLLRLDWGEELHTHVLQVGLADSLSVANSLINLYAKCGQPDSASMMFSEMSTRNIVSWSAIIGGYAQGGFGVEAFELLSCMRKEGPKPTEFTLASVLSVCGNMAILNQGKQLHAHLLTIGLDDTAAIRCGLINMYSKCGSVGEAYSIFSASEDHDIVSWTAMIKGYAEHGYSHKAIELFERIPKCGLIPDSVAFVGVLVACSHAGLIDLGYRYFNSMCKDYHINPSKEHYGCMVDLLCRAGRLSEAEKLIQSMPFEQDEVVWSTLLRASRLHGDVETGKRAAKEVLKLNPNCASTHITLANIYAYGGKLSEAAAMRKLMKSKGINKESGWSWTKVKDQVLSFVSGDRSHPRSQEIYDILNLVASRAESAFSDFAFPLDDVGG